MLDFVRFLFHMGRKRFEDVFDLVRHGANLELTCSCGRAVVVDADQLMRMKTVRHWPYGIWSAAQRFRCTRCGRSPQSALPTPKEATIRIGPTLLEMASGRRSSGDEP